MTPAFTLGLALAMLLSTAGLQAQVTYRFLGEEPARVKHFLDIDRIDVNGDLRSFWRLTNLLEKDRIGALSTRTRSELNCRERKTRSVFVIHHQGPSAGGQIIASLRAEDDAWKDVGGTGVEATLLELVCSVASSTTGPGYVKPPPPPPGSEAEKAEKAEKAAKEGKK